MEGMSAYDIVDYEETLQAPDELNAVGTAMFGEGSALFVPQPPICANTLTDAAQDALTKYKMAASIVNSVIAQIVGMLQHGSDIAMLCSFGDQLVHEKVPATGACARGRDAICLVAVDLPFKMVNDRSGWQRRISPPSPVCAPASTPLLPALRRVHPRPG